MLRAPASAEPARTGAGRVDPTSRGWLTNQRPRQRGPDSIVDTYLNDVCGQIKVVQYESPAVVARPAVACHTDPSVNPGAQATQQSIRFGRCCWRRASAQSRSLYHFLVGRSEL